MIARVLAGALAAVLAIAGGLGWMLHREVEQRAAADQALDVAISANQANKTAIDALGTEIATRDRMTSELRRRYAKSEQVAATLAARIEDIKRENADLRAYFGSTVPRLAADWLWLPAEGSHQDGGGAAGPAGLAAGSHPGPGQPVPAVDHETGWKWCKAVERALTSCNDDKAALREWVAGSP